MLLIFSIGFPHNCHRCSRNISTLWLEVQSWSRCILAVSIVIATVQSFCTHAYTVTTVATITYINGGCRVASERKSSNRRDCTRATIINFGQKHPGHSRCCSKWEELKRGGCQREAIEITHVVGYLITVIEGVPCTRTPLKHNASNTANTRSSDRLDIPESYGTYKFVIAISSYRSSGNAKLSNFITQ